MKRVIGLEPSTKRRKALLANDLLPAAVLLFAGFTGLAEGTSPVLAWISILSGGMLIGFGVREWRSFGQHSKEGIQWFDVVSGIIILVDAWAMYKPWKGFQPAYCYVAIAAMPILKGFGVLKPGNPFHRLTMTESGFVLRTGLVRRLGCAWDEIVQMSFSENTLRVVTRDNERKLSLKHFANGADVHLALMSALETSRQSREAQGKG